MAQMPDIKVRVEVEWADWTRDVEGRSNSSALFVALVGEVEAIIRGDAFKLIGGRADQTALLIMAQLAHVHGLVPASPVGVAKPPRSEP